jgi:cullin-4
LDAAIVRVMKARKELSNEDLKAATIEAVKSHFVPDVKAIKQRIEMMVEQEYLRRDEDDPNLFIYVA